MPFSNNRKPLKHARPVGPLPRMVVIALVWWTARLPLPVPDFHEVGHHHESAETCRLHDHLNRWHSNIGEHGNEPGEEESHDPLLHWHLLIPGWAMAAGEPKEDGQNQSDDSGRSTLDQALMLLPASGQPIDDSFAWILDTPHEKMDRSLAQNAFVRYLIEQLKIALHEHIIIDRARLLSLSCRLNDPLSERSVFDHSQSFSPLRC